MASIFTVLRTCGIIVYVIFQSCCADINVSDPWIVSVEVENKSCDSYNCKYLLKVRGGEFLGHYSWRLTPEEGVKGGSCDVISPNYELREVETDQWITQIEVFVPHIEGKFFFCLRQSSRRNVPFGGKWVHQGAEVFLDPKNDIPALFPENDNLVNSEKPADDVQVQSSTVADLTHDIDINNIPNYNKDIEFRKDVEILLNDKFVPLNQVGDYLQKVYDSKRNESRKENLINAADAKNVEGVGVNRIDNDFNLDSIKDSFESWNSNAKFSNRRKRDAANAKISYNARQIDKHGNENENYNKTDDLITKHDIIEAKLALANDVNIKTASNQDLSEDALIKLRRERQVTPSDFTSVRTEQFLVRIEGIRVEDSAKEPKIIEYSVPSVLAETDVTLRIFGDGLTARTVIAFTYDQQQYGEPCKFILKGEYMVQPESITPKTALFSIRAPDPILGSKLYICAKNLKLGITDPSKDDEKYIHQGTESYKVLATHTKLLPLWVSLILILVCLMFSALFSGLNLGLMSLDRTELKIISNTGTEQERKYARAIMPVRDHGNYLLCSILLGNVAVNSTFTILLDELTSGLFAVIFSTLSIVLLGEITPQAICSRHGLMVGAKSIMVTKAVMGLTAPLAYPVSKLLDYFLGEEIGSVYNRERLKELVKITTDVNDLDKDEVNIISGALELRKKKVSEVMTKLEDVFMLPISSVLDFETMSEIVKSGYSRIPVYEGGRGNIVTVLFIKDLAFVDPDDNTPLRTLCQYYQNPCNFVFEDVTLDVMFKQFKEGHKGHMAFVHRINNEGEGDPFYETIGLVTLEDVIEEMIQAEIVDETDVFMDNRSKRRRNRPQHKLQDFAAFAERHENQRIHISPQLTLATFQFLSTSVDAFRPDTVSETVLRRLLRQDVIQHIKLKGKTKKDPTTFVFHQGKPVDYFVLILEGRVEVTVGRENLVFEAGPFTYFGVQALTQNVGLAESPTPSTLGSLQNITMDSILRHTFVPDYSVRAITEVFYLTVKRSLYLAAKRATLMEKGALSKGATNEQFDTEVDKHLCNSSSANIPISMISKKLLGKSTSTASTRDDLGSTSTGFKLSSGPRVNIIELLQVSAKHSTSSERAENILDSEKRCNKMSTKSFACSWEATGGRIHDATRSQTILPQELSKSLNASTTKNRTRNETDADNCVECLKNNFWIKKSALNKSCDDVEGRGKEPNSKKKTTFYADSSLLTFRPVSPPTRDLDLSPSSSKNCKSDPDFSVNQKHSIPSSVPADDRNIISQSAFDFLNDRNEVVKDRAHSICKIGEDFYSDDATNFKSCGLTKTDVTRQGQLDFEAYSSVGSPEDKEFERHSVDYSVECQNVRLLQSVDEDISISGEHRTPSRQVSPNPLPVSASPHTRSSFASRTSPELRHAHDARQDEQEKLLKSP